MLSATDASLVKGMPRRERMLKEGDDMTELLHLPMIPQTVGH
jgi:hypothetical protein